MLAGRVSAARLAAPGDAGNMDARPRDRRSTVAAPSGRTPPPHGIVLRCRTLNQGRPRQTELRALVAEVDLHQHLDGCAALGGHRLHAAQQVAAVDGVDARERTHGLADLVRLQVADQVPGDRRSATWAILGSASCTRFSPNSRCRPRRRPHVLGTERLRNGDETNVRRGTATPTAARSSLEWTAARLEVMVAVSGPSFTSSARQARSSRPSRTARWVPASGIPRSAGWRR